MITALTSGMATAFASGPTTDTWANRNTAAGASPSVIAHWMRAHCSAPRACAVQPIET